MKVKYFLGMCLVGMVGFLTYTTISAGELPWERKLPFEHATIHYTVSGVEQGTQIVYIRDFGREQATYSDTTTKIMGMSVNEKSVEFVDVDFVYSYDLQAHEGTKSVNPQKYLAESYTSLTLAEKKQVQKNAGKMRGALTDGMDGAVQQNAAKILNYDCDKIDIMGGGSTYLLHGTSLPLKTEVNMMGMKMTTTAISVDTAKVDTKKFIHPKGIDAKVDRAADAMAQAMGRQAMDAFKDPDTSKIGLGAGANRNEMQKNMTEEDKQMLEQAGEMLKGMKDIFSQ